MDDYEKHVFGVNSYENIAKEIYKKDMRHYHNSAANLEFPDNPDESKSEKQKLQIQIVGNLITREYIICCDLATRLYKFKKSIFKVPIIIGLVQMDWIPYRFRLHWELPEVYMGHTHVAVSIDNHEIGDEREFIKWVNKRFRIHYNKGFHTQGLKNLISFFDVNPHLYNDICPETCENFLRICRDTKNGLTGTPIHRIVPECWIQGGGYVLPKNRELLFENYIISHHRRGVLTLSHCCHSTQFIVTLGDQTWMNQRYVAFGQLIYGEDILKRIEAVPEKNDAPESHILILKVTIYREEPERDHLHEEISDYLKDHVEDVIQFTDILIDEIFLAFEIEIENKFAQDETEMEGEDLLTPNRENISRNASHQIYPTPVSSYSRDVRPKREFYHPFSDVCSTEDGSQYLHAHKPRISERPSSVPRRTSYRKKAEKIISEWLAGSTTLRVIHGRGDKDTPLQKLMKKKITPGRARAPTIKDSRKKSTNDAYFTISCNLHFSNSDDSSFERIAKRKYVLNEAAFSKMAVVYDKSSVHRKLSYNYFASQAEKMDFSTELIKLTSLRVHEYASRRPCMSVEDYVDMNKARKGEEAAMIKQEELQANRKEMKGRYSTKSVFKEGCECCLLPKKICMC